MNPYGSGGVIERTRMRTKEGGEEKEGMGKIIGRQFPGQKSKRERRRREWQPGNVYAMRHVCHLHKHATTYDVWEVSWIL